MGISRFDSILNQEDPESSNYRKWKKMCKVGLEEYSRNKWDRFYRRFKRGVCAQFRWEAWTFIIQSKVPASEKDRRSEENFERLRKITSKYTSIIKIDVVRTFPDIKEFFKRDQTALFNILNAYANLEPNVGYCQGMNFVAGFLLIMNGGESTYAVFELFSAIMEEYGLRGFYSETFPLLQAYVTCYNTELNSNLPDLARHFRNQQVLPQLYLYQWFLSLFVTGLPLNTIGISWDLWIIDGLRTIIPFTLGLLSTIRYYLLPLKFEDILLFMKSLKFSMGRKEDFEIGKLLNSCCDKFPASGLSTLSRINQNPVQDRSRLLNRKYIQISRSEEIKDKKHLESTELLSSVQQLAPPRSYSLVNILSTHTTDRVTSQILKSTQLAAYVGQSGADAIEDKASWSSDSNDNAGNLS